MEIYFKVVKEDELQQVLGLFKNAAIQIAKKGVDHWQYWNNPPQHKIDWVLEGIHLGQLKFVLNGNNELLGMVRVLDEDLLYWGKQETKAKYMHSLVVVDEFLGAGLGEVIIQKIERFAKKESCSYLRLDCDAKNPKLCNYYIKLGFEKVSEIKLPLSTYNLYQKKV